MLASVVIKIEYHRTLQQGIAQAPRQPLITDSLAATKPSISSLAAAFLPGSAQYVEMAVTHSKQTTANFLPGSRIAHQGSDCRNHLTRFLSELSPLSVPTIAVVEVSRLPLHILSDPHRLAVIQRSSSALWR